MEKQLRSLTSGILLGFLLCAFGLNCTQIFNQQHTGQRRLIDMPLHELMEIPVVYHSEPMPSELIDMPIEELMDVSVA